MKDKTLRTGSVLALLVLLLLLGVSLAVGRAQAPNQAGLVVQFGDGSLVTRCIEFNEPEINSYDLLLRSGLAVVVSGDSTVGMAVCSIEEEGCQASDCFCQCKGSTCTYWSYWHLVDGAWQYSSMGASGHTAASGDVEGWAWGEAEPPPVLPFEEICVPPVTDTPEPTPTWAPSPTPVPTDTPSPSPVPPTDTPPPTETPLPTGTTAPTATDLPSATPTATEPNTMASTAAPVLVAEGSSGSQPGPTSTPSTSTDFPEEPTPVQIDTPRPSPMPLTPTPTLVVESSATPTQPPPATASLVAEIRPTLTPLPTLIALVPDPAPGAVFESATVGQASGEADSNRQLVTILSVGAGAVYILFVLFVAFLAGLFFIVRLRQN